MSITRGYIGFARAVDEYENHMINDLKRVVSETTEIAVSQMKALAPVDEGYLKRSIDSQYLNRGLSSFIMVAASYGLFVEYGTGKYATKPGGRLTPWTYYKDGKYYTTEGMHAQPFFHPSIEIAREHFESEMRNLGS